MTAPDTAKRSTNALIPQAQGAFDDLTSMTLDKFVSSRLAVLVYSGLFGSEVIFRSDSVSPDSEPREILSLPVSDYRHLNLIVPLSRPIKTFGNLLDTFEGRIIDVCNHN